MASLDCLAAMSELTKSMCWELLEINEDKLNEVGVAIFRKPTTNDCYQSRTQNDPPMCEEADDPDAAWYVSLIYSRMGFS